MPIFMYENRVYFTKEKANAAQSSAEENPHAGEGKLKRDVPSPSTSNNPHILPQHPDPGENFPPDSSDQNRLVHHDYLANDGRQKPIECEQSPAQKLQAFLQQNWKIIAGVSAVAFVSIIVVLGAVVAADLDKVPGNLCGLRIQI